MTRTQTGVWKLSFMQWNPASRMLEHTALHPEFDFFSAKTDLFLNTEVFHYTHSPLIYLGKHDRF